MSLVLGARLILCLGVVGVGLFIGKHERFFWPGLVFIVLVSVVLGYGLVRYYQPIVEPIRYMVG